MVRVPKHIAAELIQYVKKVEFVANFWDPNSKSAFEFARQMSSPKLKKINPSLEVSLSKVNTDTAPSLAVEFIDGSKWSTLTTGLHATDLRGELYERAADAEDKVGDTKDGGGGDSGSTAAKKGGKAGGKK